MPVLESLGHLINFTVDKETCIGCRACAEAFPEQFQMDDDANKAYTTGVPAGSIDIYEPVVACPVDSIAIVDFKARLLLTPQQVRDKEAVPQEKLDLAANDFDAMPAERKAAILELGSRGAVVTKVGAAGGASDAALSEQWLTRFAPTHGPLPDARPPRLRPWLRALLIITEPIWGAASDRFKSRLAEIAGEQSGVSPGSATTLNTLLNFLLYPAVVWLAFSGRFLPFALEGNWLLFVVLFFGLGLFAMGECVFRLKDEIFAWGITERDRVYPGSVYGAWLGGPLLRVLERLYSTRVGREALFETGTAPRDEEEEDRERERERLYGRAMSVSRLPEGGVELLVEFPSRLHLASGEALDLPEYVHDVVVRDHRLVVRGWIADPRVESRWSYRDPFPLSFERELELPGQVAELSEERTGRKLRLKIKLAA